MTTKRGMLVVLVMLVAVVLIAGARVGQRFVSSSDPCGTLTGSLADVGDALGAFDGTVTAVAHNAGTSEEEVRRALGCGATVIELDLVLVDDTLRVAHEPPAPSGRKDALPLAELWPVATEAPVVVLDFKSTSREVVDRLIAFLNEHQAPEAGEVAVSSKSMDVLATVEEQAPDVLRFLSLDNERDLRAFQGDSEARQTVQGLTLEESLIDEEVMAWLDRHDLQVWAWTVDNPLRADDLVGLGVDGIITDNLALLDALPSSVTEATAVPDASARRN